MLNSKSFIIFLIIVVSIAACNNDQQKKQQKKSNLSFNKLSKQERNNYHRLADIFYAKNLQFTLSGGILVAKNGEIVFEKYNGYSNWLTQEKMDANTSIHIASVSKTFTAVAILKMVQENKLSLQDSVQKFFPNFPYKGVTVKLLLSHRSGLPNYLYFMDTAWKTNTFIQNKDVLNYLIDKQPAAYPSPNRVFHYCNTNYVLLALIVEKIVGIDFPSYVKNNIFIPLGMKNSYVFNIADSAKYTPSFNYNNQPIAIDKFDVVYGDKNVYSTVKDMFLWDKALYDTSFIGKQILQQTFTPYSNEKAGHKNYGLGFRLYIDGADTTVYHNGWWHGNNSVFIRLTQDTATIITLGNKYNRSIYTSRQLTNIFSKKNTVSELEE